MSTVPPMNLVELLTIDVEVEPVLDLGDVRTGVRRLIPFTRGTFRGRDGLAGTLAPGGTDWQLVRSDGTFEIDAHYVLRTDGGALIEVRSIGIRRASAEVLDRIAAGEPVDPGEYYFRTHIRLATADPTLALDERPARRVERRAPPVSGAHQRVRADLTWRRSTTSLADRAY